MTHVVAGYPSFDECVELMLGMQEAGVNAIEVQIPFSDPSADGPVIMDANDTALKNGMTIDHSFKLIKEARGNGLTIPIYVMSYVNKLYSYGFDLFCRESAKGTVSGLIIPDLTPGSNEYLELKRLCIKEDVDLVPVLSPATQKTVIKSYGISPDSFVYLTSSKGITGTSLTVRDELLKTVQLLRKTKCTVALGFGIKSPQDVRSALEIVDTAVIGSEIVRRINKEGVARTIKYVQMLVNSEKEIDNEN